MTTISSHRGGAPSGGFCSVLVPVDLSPSCDRVLGRIVRLPLADDARVRLLHVVPASLPHSEKRRAELDADKALADEARHLGEQIQHPIRVERVVTVGATAKSIAAGATEMQAELIVMGRGGGRMLRDSFLGSTAERVIRQARIPVLVVRLAPRAAYTRPAFALDLDGAVQHVVPLLRRVLRPPRPRVDVIHAFQVPFEGLIYPSLSSDGAEAHRDELRSKLADQVAASLASAAMTAAVRPGDEISWKIDIQYGSPRTVVDKAIKKAETDLLVVGTRGSSGAAFMFLGTVAGDLLRRARCDVLAVPPGTARE